MNRNNIYQAFDLRERGNGLPTTRVTNEIVRALRGMRPLLVNGQQTTPNTEPAYVVGYITDTGPLGTEPDYTDNRYWVQPVYIVGDTADAALAYDDSDTIIQPGPVTASALDSEDHDLPTDGSVYVTLFYELDPDSNLRFWFYTKRLTIDVGCPYVEGEGGAPYTNVVPNADHIVFNPDKFNITPVNYTDNSSTVFNTAFVDLLGFSTQNFNSYDSTQGNCTRIDKLLVDTSKHIPMDDPSSVGAVEFKASVSLSYDSTSSLTSLCGSTCSTVAPTAATLNVSTWLCTFSALDMGQPVSIMQGSDGTCSLTGTTVSALKICALDS